MRFQKAFSRWVGSAPAGSVALGTDVAPTTQQPGTQDRLLGAVAFSSAGPSVQSIAVALAAPPAAGAITCTLYLYEEATGIWHACGASVTVTPGTLAYFPVPAAMDRLVNGAVESAGGLDAILQVDDPGGLPDGEYRFAMVASASKPVAAGGGGGGSVDEVAQGAGITVTNGTGPTVTVAAKFGTGSGFVAQATAAAFAAVLGIMATTVSADPYAASGTFRLQRRQSIVARNDGDTADIPWISQSSGDVITVGGANNAGVQIDVPTGQTVAARVNSTAVVTVSGSAVTASQVVVAPSFQLTDGSGPTISTGAGAPASTPADGSFYLRNNGTSATTAYVRAAGAWSALGAGGASITWATDLAGSSDTSQVVIGLTGASSKTIIRATSAGLEWVTATSSPYLGIADNVTASATGTTLSVLGQNATGGSTANGGFVAVLAGAGSGGGVSGAVQIGDRSGGAFASTGVVRLQRLVSIRARNNGDTGNLNIASTNASDQIQYGGTLNAGLLLGTATGNTVAVQVDAVTQFAVVDTTSIDVTPTTVQWLAATATPTLTQIALGSGTGAVMKVQAQGAGTGTGGKLTLAGGTGSTAAGVVEIANGSTTIATVQVGTSSVGALLVNSGTSTSIAAELQTSATTRWQFGFDGTNSYIRNASTAVGTSGYIRTTSATANYWTQRNSGNTADIIMMGADTTSLYLGGNSSGSSASQVIIWPASALILGVNNGGKIIIGSSETTYNGNASYRYANTIAANVRHYFEQRGSNAACFSVTWEGQQPNASATGANQIPGDFIIKTHAATNGGTTHANIRLQAKATDVFVVSHDNTYGTISFPTVDLQSSDPGTVSKWMKCSINGVASWFEVRQ